MCVCVAEIFMACVYSNMNAWASCVVTNCSLLVTLSSNMLVVYLLLFNKKPLQQAFLDGTTAVSTVTLLASPSPGTVKYTLFRRGGVTCSGLCSGLEVSCNILHESAVCGDVCPCYRISLCHYNISVCKFTSVIHDMISIKMEMVLSSFTH